jgi:hypothetical protein
MLSPPGSPEPTPVPDSAEQRHQIRALAGTSGKEIEITWYGKTRRAITLGPGAWVW